MNNIEKKIKIVAAGLIVMFTAVFLLTGFFYFNIMIMLLSFAGIFVGFVFLVVFEAYLRIQHNIDDKFRDFSDFRKLFLEEISKISLSLLEEISKISLSLLEEISKISLSLEEISKIAENDVDNRISGLEAELDKKFFMLKNDLEFKILNFRFDTEKKLSLIIELLKNNKMASPEEKEKSF